MLSMAIIMLCNKQLQILRAFNQRLFLLFVSGFLGDSWFWCCHFISVQGWLAVPCPLSSVVLICGSNSGSICLFSLILHQTAPLCPSRKWQWPQMAMPIWASSLSLLVSHLWTSLWPKLIKGIKHRAGNHTLQINLALIFERTPDSREISAGRLPFQGKGYGAVR